MTKYTFDIVEKEAKKYNTHKDFRKAQTSMYQICHRNGWLDEICVHMPPPTTRTRWTVDMVKREASKYTTTKDFRGGSPGAYAWAHRHGLISEITANFTSAFRWTDDAANQVARKYSTRVAFWDNDAGAARYLTSLGGDAYETACAHMPTTHRLTADLTDEEIIAIGMTYKSSADFSRGSPSAYQSAVWRKLLAGMTAERERQNPKETIDQIIERAKPFKTHKAFREADPVGYGRLIRSPRADEACLTKGVNKWTEESIRLAASEFKTRTSFSKVHGYFAITVARDLGILDEILPLTEAGKNTRRWTVGALIEEAKKYDSITQFHAESSGAWEAVVRLGVMETVCAHMVRKTSHTPESVVEVAKTYKTRKAFKHGNHGAYKAAKRYGVFEEACAHMPEPRSTDDDEVYLYEYRHPEGYVYVGITSSPEARHEKHRTESHNSMVQFMAEDMSPDVYSRYSKYDNTLHPVSMDRRTAERFERMTIRARVGEGYKVVNCVHNPQYSRVTGFLWEQPSYHDKLCYSN
jgi:hypothetical protein